MKYLHLFLNVPRPLMTYMQIHLNTLQKILWLLFSPLDITNYTMWNKDKSVKNSWLFNILQCIHSANITFGHPSYHFNIKGGVVLLVDLFSSLMIFYSKHTTALKDCNLLYFSQLINGSDCQLLKFTEIMHRFSTR
jgi:hypothetical protein